MRFLCLADLVTLCALGCTEEEQLPDSNGEKTDDSGTYSEGDVGFWASYMEDCPVIETDVIIRALQYQLDALSTTLPD